MNALLLIIFPAAMMLHTWSLSVWFEKSAAAHLASILCVGLFWNRLGRDWLAKHARSDDESMALSVFYTLVFGFPVSYFVGFIVAYCYGSTLTPLNQAITSAIPTAILASLLLKRGSHA